MPIQKGRTPDRRIARTQKLLRDALHSLIHERDYDSIAVKEILDRANVGRSAFYMHFRDKDDLLAATFHDIFGSVPSMRPETGDRRTEKILGFSLPIFEHLDRLRRAGELRLGPRGRAILHGHLQKALVELIAEEVGKSLQGRRKLGGQVPHDVVVQFVASTFILVLNWWVDSRSKLSPKQVDDLFRALILPTLASTSE
ncbi:TetR/AcrR family transcriptional regulator [Edaphobacter aggregans]|uniref:TetR/AcrR family transcriptional regulator n=1 Tax=Edaphobacter aggregans TaxID=570835 RepID=UPI00068A60B8|nr:TetR/AcrR family transcriptional regulator [Edaphobacter aggregans]